MLSRALRTKPTSVPCELTSEVLARLRWREAVRTVQAVAFLSIPVSTWYHGGRVDSILSLIVIIIHSFSYCTVFYISPQLSQCCESADDVVQVPILTALQPVCGKSKSQPHTVLSYTLEYGPAIQEYSYLIVEWKHCHRRSSINPRGRSFRPV